MSLGMCRAVLYSFRVEKSDQYGVWIRQTTNSRADPRVSDKYKDGFQVHGVTTDIELSGTCGSMAIFEENWTIAPTGSKALKEFIRKIQTSGSLPTVHCTGCDIQIRKFMEGIYLLTMIPTQSAMSGNVVSYQLKYQIENGFAFGEELWNFDFDCPTESFEFNFRFSDECLPGHFQAHHRSDGKDSPYPHSQKDHHYQISASNVQSGESIVVKWKWHH